MRNSLAVYKFTSALGPFSAPECRKALSAYQHIQRIQQLLSAEAVSVKNALNLEEVDWAVSPEAQAVLAISRHSIDIAVDHNDLGNACAALDGGHITTEVFVDTVIELGANLLGIALTASYILRGVASTLSPVDYPHEIMATSALRVEALANEVKAIVGSGVITAITAA